MPHRQFVFTMPKRFRLYFRFNRELLRKLPVLAWQAVLQVYRAVLDRDDVTAGMIVCIHTFGGCLSPRLDRRSEHWYFVSDEIIHHYHCNARLSIRLLRMQRGRAL